MDRISCAKDFIFLYMQTHTLKCSPEISDKKESSGLKIKTLDLHIINLYLVNFQICIGLLSNEKIK